MLPSLIEPASWVVNFDTPAISAVPAYRDSFIAWLDVVDHQVEEDPNDLEKDAGPFREIFHGVLDT
jgi:hypothetical protein